MLSRCRLIPHAVARLSRSNAARDLTTDGRKLVLGIESSCDDSCAAIVSAPQDYFRGTRSGATVHNSIVIKQDHGVTKGIEPLVAANSHQAGLPIAIRQALQGAQRSGVIKDAGHPVEIDAIAVTQGPGMNSSLSQGLMSAKLLASLWDCPLIYVHHMIAHTLTPYLTAHKEIEMPFLVFLVSGGHTQLVLCQSTTQFTILATSEDDSIGSALDKAARELQIDFDWARQSPGAALEAFARQNDVHAYKFTLPFPQKPAFSFSGLRSAMLRMLQEDRSILASEDKRRSLAHAVQKSAFAQIQDKLTLALQSSDGLYGPHNIDGDVASRIRDVVVSGGVASNQTLRGMLQETLHSLQRQDVQLHFPPLALCTDNAAMIAHAGLISCALTTDLKGKPRSRWSVEDYDG